MLCSGKYYKYKYKHKSYKKQMKLVYLFGFICILVTIARATAVQQDYTKITNTLDPEARCLDGSPATMYVHEGTQKNKILIFLQGGGMCGDTTLPKTIESCYQRSKTLLGSSKQWPKTIQGQGYLSTDPSKNKFANWTKFIFIYCDGSIHQGNTQTPLKYKDSTLYFRGARIVRSHFQWIQQNYQMSNADNVLLTGCSAGAVASLYWTNYLSAMLKNPSVLSTIADSAIFLDVKTQGGMAKIQSSAINIFKVANVDQKSPLQICNSFYYNSQWKCLFAVYAFPSVQGRVLLIQSEYDSFAIQYYLDINCLKVGKSGLTMSNCTNSQMKTIEKYRDLYMDFASNFMQFPKNSLWTIACSNHCYASIDFYYDSNDQRVPSTIGQSVKDAVQNFVFQKKRIADIDAQKWPGNRPCAY